MLLQAIQQDETNKEGHYIINCLSKVHMDKNGNLILVKDIEATT